MGIFFWKKNKEIDLFAGTIAGDMFSSVQPDAAKEYLDNKDKNKKSKTDKNVERKIHDIAGRIGQFRTSNSLGVYGKARLHMTFMDRLEELGYDKPTVKRINEILLLKSS